MTAIRTALRRLIDWLAEQQPAPEQTLSPRNWSDLPTWHPAADTCR